MRNPAQWAGALALLPVIVLCLLIYAEVGRLNETVSSRSDTIEHIIRGGAVPDHTTTWNIKEGGVPGTHTVNTTCNPGESEEDCLKRHRARVDRAKQEFPPDC